MGILPEAINLFKAIPIKIPKTFVTEVEKSTLTLKRQNIMNNLRQYCSKKKKKSNARGITVHGFKLYYRTITIKTA
jgi:hypothetical protein